MVTSSYISWIKARSPVAGDLTNSQTLPCTLDDLPGARDAVSLDGRHADSYPPLVDAIAARYGVPAGCVATAAGTSGANLQVIAALAGPGDDVLVEFPGYEPLASAVRFVGARPVPFDRSLACRFALDPDRVRRALTPATRLVVITSLHNPSGLAAGIDALAEVGRLAAGIGAHVLVDEVYLDSARGARTSAATLGPLFVVTNSLTKAYGLGSLRCGWAVAAPAPAAAIHRVRDLLENTGSVVTERLGALAFEHLPALAARADALLGPNRDAVSRFVDSRPELDWVPPDGGTVAFPRLRGVDDATPFVTRLFEQYDTAVVPGHFFGAPAHFRIAWGASPDAVRRGLEGLERALDRDTPVRT